MKKVTIALLLTLVLIMSTMGVAGAAQGRQIGVNVVLKTDITDALLADLGTRGKVRDVIYAIDAVTMQIAEGNLSAIRALPYVAAANPDSEVRGVPIDTVTATDFANGFNTWDQDAINVTNFGAGRTIGYDGSGVYVAVLDTGLLYSWREYFPEERIAEEFGIAFGGGGGDVGTVSTQPDKWQQDTNSHGTHVTSTILGYSLFGTPINGTAPKATVIPVKVLNQSGSGWSSAVARGIMYVAELKTSGALGSSPVVINMSLGDSSPDALTEAAINFAISKGIIVVASAGNSGTDGMGYPGAFPQVISAAASGWTGQWLPGADNNVNNWWNADDVQDPTAAANFYIADFSGRQLAGQDLDVVAPGAWVVGSYQTQQGSASYFYLSGTSMASPHVAGIAALMLQKRPSLTQSQIETILQNSAIALPAGCRNIVDPNDGPIQVCWGADATGSGLTTADAALRATR